MRAAAAVRERGAAGRRLAFLCAGGSDAAQASASGRLMRVIFPTFTARKVLSRIMQ
jgi:hypothetical protein